MTRIALLPSAYPPSLGGVEELTRHLALSLKTAGDQVEVWTGQPIDATPETAEVLDDVVVRRLPMPLPATNWPALCRSATVGIRTVRSLKSAVAAFRPDVLHVQCFGPNGTYATALAKLTGLPLIVTLQGETLMDDADIFDRSQVLRRSLRAGLRHAAAVTACSSFTLEDAERRFGLASGRGVVVPNGVELATGSGWQAPTTGYAPVPDDPERRYILALGRVVEKKGFDLLVAAFAAIPRARRSADLVIGGTGDQLGFLRSEAERLGVADQVHFVGSLSRTDVARAMAGAQLFVMPSRLEPFGIVILEAWRAGVAVVATSHGGPPEFVRHDGDGLLVDPLDADSFAATLQALLDDPDRRRSLAAAGRARVTEFDWAVIAERYRGIYRSVTAGQGADDGTAARSEPAASRQGEAVG